MKRIYNFRKLLVLLGIVLLCGTVYGQSTANYSFAASTDGTLVDMSSGATTILAVTSVGGDFASPVTNIGFPFVFMGVSYTQFSVNSNGLLRFGPTVVSSAFSNNLNSTATMPHLSAFWDDLNNVNDLSSKVHIKLLGEAPNRTLVIEWKDFVMAYNANVPPPASTWQVWLHENGAIDFVYGHMAIQGGSPTTASIGFAVAAADNKVLSVTNLAVPAVSTLTSGVVNNLVNSSVVGPIAGLHSTEEGSRVVFSFAPPAAPLAPTMLTFSDIQAGSMTLNWVDNATTETGYFIFRSTDGVNFTLVHTAAADVDSWTATGLLPSTNYHWRVIAFNEGAISLPVEASQSTAPALEIVSVASGNWDDPATWSGGAVPGALDNVTVSADHVVVLNAAGAFNNLTVNGTLQMQGFTLAGGGVVINEDGEITVLEGTLANLSVSLNITNHGVLNFFESNVQIGRITFTGVQNQVFTTTGTTNLGNVTVNKGTSRDLLVDIVTGGAFTIRSGATAGFLTLTNGTAKISGTTAIASEVFLVPAWSIPANAGFWLDNPNFEVLPLTGSPTNNGLLRLTQGTINIGTAAGNSLGGGANAIFTIEGGVLNLASRLQTTSAITLNMSGGVINANLVGNVAATAAIGLTSFSNTINISGGEINLVRRSGNSTPLDYSVQGASVNITGGVLRIGRNDTPEPYNFVIQGVIPSLVVDNTENPKSVWINGATSVFGNITLPEGTVLDCRANTLQVIGNASFPGNILNNGLITNTSATGSNRFTFAGAHGLQTLSGDGSLGNLTTPFAGINVINPDGIAVLSPVVTNRINMFTGDVSGAENITLGNEGTSATVVQKGGNNTLVPGNFDQTPVLNHGVSYGVVYGTAAASYETGFELPAVLPGNLTMTSNQDVVLSASASVNVLAFSTTNTGKLITAADKLLTVAGTEAGSVVMNTGNQGFVKGPLARTVAPNQASGLTLMYPVGKGSLNAFDLINPITGEDDPVVIVAEVFDEASGGTAGFGLQDESLGSRYWKAEILSGADNFVTTAIRVNQPVPALIPENAIGRSLSVDGEYSLVSTNPATASAVTSDELTTLGYFAIGLKQLPQTYVSSEASHPQTGIVLQGDQNQVILKLEVIASGNFDPKSVTQMVFNTTGTTDVDDITLARLYYTGSATAFSDEVQMGEAVVNPSGEFTFTLNQELADGINNFWLTYDISMDAVNLNVVDAQAVSLTVGGDVFVPVVTDPEGNRTIRGRLAGVYTVGAEGNFPTITAAVSELALVGVKDMVVFSLIDTEYAANETFPITIAPVNGGSIENYVVIKPAPGVTAAINANSTGPVFVVEASWLMIDGSNTPDGQTRDLTLANSGTAASSGVIFSTNNSFVSFRNLIARASASNTAYGIVLSGTSQAEVVNNRIERTNVGIQAQTNSAEIMILHNEIGSQVAADKIHTQGITIFNSTVFDVSGNIIRGVASASSSTASGILVTGTSAIGFVRNNVISDVKNTNSVGWGSNGIQLASTNTAASVSVYNNMISDVASAGYSGWGIADNGYGVVISAGGAYGLYHNTVVMNTDQSGTSGGNTTALLVTSGVSTAATLDIRNNMFISTQTKGNRYAIYSGAGAAVYAFIDHNNYIAPTGVGFMVSARPTLADWQNATGKDASSLSIAPVFTSAQNFVPAANANCALDNAGVDVGILNDLNGLLRDADTPDIGAYEFTSVPLAIPVAESPSVCSNEAIPALLATVEGTARWYSDEELTALVHTGSTFNTGITAPGVYTWYVTDNLGSCVSEALAVTLTIFESPATPAIPVGPVSVVSIDAAEYTIAAVSGATHYTWTLTPENAGTVAGTGTTAAVTWNQSFEGAASLSVVAHNDNCSSAASAALQITVTGPTLTLVANPVPGGSVTGGGNYPVGATVAIEATANMGYSFVNWTDAANQVVSVAPAFSYTMPAAHTTLTANFALIDYTLTLVANPAEGGSLTGAGDYTMGQQVAVAAAVNSGYVFVNWTSASGDQVSDQAAFTFTMPAENVTLTANFSQVFEVVFAVVEGNGALQAAVDGNAIQTGAMVPAGSNVVFTATPDAGYKLKEWTLNGQVVQNHTALTFTLNDLNADANVTVEFELITYLLTFEVTSATQPLEGAVIAIDGETLTTNAAGIATIDLVPGTYNYTVNKEGYLEVNGALTLEDDMVVPVNLQGVGVAENSLSDLTLYPNPFAGYLMINDAARVKHVVISTLHGQVVDRIETAGNARINTENLPAGVYIITLETISGERRVLKMVKN